MSCSRSDGLPVQSGAANLRLRSGNASRRTGRIRSVRRFFRRLLRVRRSSFCALFRHGRVHLLLLDDGPRGRLPVPASDARRQAAQVPRRHASRRRQLSASARTRTAHSQTGLYLSTTILCSADRDRSHSASFQLLATFLGLVIFEDSRCQWSMSRPLLGLILLQEEAFAQYKLQLISSQPSPRQQKLDQCFVSLMEGVERNLSLKNKDRQEMSFPCCSGIRIS